MSATKQIWRYWIDGARIRSVLIRSIDGEVVTATYYRKWLMREVVTSSSNIFKTMDGACLELQARAQKAKGATREQMLRTVARLSGKGKH